MKSLGIKKLFLNRKAFLFRVPEYGKKYIFFENICFLQNIRYLQKKMFLYGKKKL